MILRLRWLTLWTLATLAMAGAQETPAEPALSADEVRARLERVEADASLEDAGKALLRAKYEEAAAALQRAADRRAEAGRYAEALQSAPAETEALRRQLDATAAQPPATLPADAREDELRKEADKQRAALATLEEKLAAAEAELARATTRPVEIGARFPTAEAELNEIRSKLALAEDNPTPGRLADRTVLEARAAELAAEIEMLRRETDSHSARESLLGARRDLLQRQRDDHKAALEVLDQRLTQVRSDAVATLAAGVAALSADASPGPQELAPRVEELRAAAQRIETVADSQSALLRDTRELSRQAELLQEQMKLGRTDGGLAQLVLDRLRQLPNPRGIEVEIRHLEDELRATRLAAFQIDHELEETPAADADPEAVTVRADLLRELRKTYATLVRSLARLHADQRIYRDLVLRVRDDFSEQLFWQRSSPALSTEWFDDLAPAAEWAFAPEPWVTSGRSLAGIPARHPVATAAVAFALVVLLALRRRLKRDLEECGRAIRRLSTDRYSFTLRALLDSLLLALPVPLAVGWVAWGLLLDPAAAPWTRGFGQGLAWTALFLAWMLGLREISRPGGLGIAHFGWHPDSGRRLRRVLLGFLAAYIPAILLASTTFYEESTRHFDSLGRLGFSVAHLGIAWVLSRGFHPSRGVFAPHIEKHPDRLVSRLRHVWFPLLVAAPLVLVAMAGMGYFITALTLSVLLQNTLRLISLGVVVYGLASRWFLIKERRLALEEALEQRRARREAARDADAAEEVVPATEEEEIELADVGLQTRRLLRSLVGVGVIIATWFLWTEALPTAEARRVLVLGLSPLALAQTLLLIVITITVVRNLPGLLDLAGLRATGMDAGTRYAVATICQYVSIAIAIALVFRSLDLDFTQFGWIAAALSVGLGFGLQEIVANFVCGIILLFERPIRVGDVVTVDNVTGTVSRIRMRATTITNWDRQDLVVPNKNFITGSLINWTLGSAINRVVVPVGVAYGSDTAEARRILQEIADQHPRLLKDPPPFTTFEAFGDSTLNLVLRGYLPDLDYRLKTITELHEEIDRRFREAGIEIAFPQRDLHLRSVDAAALQHLRGGDA